MADRKKQVRPKRGEIWLVQFDPTIGAEIKKTRPALILQNDIANLYSAVTIVAAITSAIDEKLYPSEVLLQSLESGLRKDSAVLLNQIRTIDNKRLMKKIGSVENQTMERVNRAIEISLGLIDL
jgi:mRNA interferase MazF